MDLMPCDVSLQHTNSRTTSLDDYEIIRTIGTGSFGRVMLARLRSNARNAFDSRDERIYAIKALDKRQVRCRLT
jgi:serine/threonine protein kinase